MTTANPNQSWEEKARDLWPLLRSRIPRLASLRIAVVCLVLLFILTSWGTIYQAEHGLYAAQIRFFYSWYFLVWGFLPLPGTQLVLWVFTLNLVASMLFRVKYKWSNIGNIVTHAGLLFLLVGSFVTYHYSVESFLPLQENEVSNVSLDRRQWELATWIEPTQGFEKQVSTYKIGPRNSGKHIDFTEFGFSVAVVNYLRNCEKVTRKSSSGTMDPDLGKLVPRRPFPDPEDNVAGVLLNVIPAHGDPQSIGLYGAYEQPARVDVGGQAVQIALRKQRHPLPFAIKLLDFRKDEHPGTAIARSYESDVEVTENGASRNTRIFMNNPLRDGNHTLFQSSFFVDERGQEHSVFAVVENKGRLIPYVASTLIFGGMAIHFLIMLFGHGKRRENGAGEESKLDREREAIPAGKAACCE